jgi:collagen type III alpha
MSAQSSKHYFALVDHHAAKGLQVAAWAQVKGSALGAEVVLQAAKASEVDDAYLNGAPVTMPQLVPSARQYQVPPAYTGPARPERAERPKSSPNTVPTAARAQATKHGATAAKSGCAVVAVALLSAGGGLMTAIHQLLS